MKTTATIILFAFILGLLSWLAEGLADYYTFYQGIGSVWDALIYISVHELYGRLAVLLIFVIFGIVIATAIARRKRIEVALRESQLRLNKSQEIAHLGSWELDVLANHLIWSDEVYRIFGLQPQEFKATYEAFLDAVYPDDRAAVGEAYFGSIREGKDSYEIEHRVVRKHTGEIRYVYEKCEHVRDASGRVIRSLGMVQDITERKQAEESLRLTQFSVDHASEAAYWIDSEARFSYVNNAACQSLGYSREELLGMTVFDIDPVITREQWDEIWLDMEQHGSSKLESVHRTKQGELFPVEIATSFLEFGGKKYDFAFVRNITERKRSEEEKRQFYRETVKSITQGKLNLISCDELNEYLNAAELVLTAVFPSDTSVVRHEVKEFCTSKGLRGEKLELFETAVGEAITNAIKHAQGGRVYVGTLNDSIWVAVSDDGPGISTLTLPSATLRMGYSTKASMGMGYSIMMEASDRIMLCTGPQGTTVVLSISITTVEHDLSLDDLPDTWTNLSI